MKSFFGRLRKTNSNGETLLFNFVNTDLTDLIANRPLKSRMGIDRRDEEQLYKAIEVLLNAKVNPNRRSEDLNNTFLHTAMCNYSKFSDDFILLILKKAIDKGFDVNSINECNATILDIAIFYGYYNGSVVNLYKMLCQYGLSNKSKANALKCVDASFKDHYTGDRPNKRRIEQNNEFLEFYHKTKSSNIKYKGYNDFSLSSAVIRLNQEIEKTHKKCK